MDELHAVIVEYLRRHNPHLLTPCPSPVPLLMEPRCQQCGQRITAEGEQFDAAVLVAARRCLDCYLREVA